MQHFNQTQQIMKHAGRSQSEARLKAMVNLAQSEFEVSRTSDRLDQDVFLLNCLNGTIDLRTGDVRDHQPVDMLTKLAEVEFDAAAKCPQWSIFLDRIFAGNQAVIGFTQRLIGYALTGNTREQVWVLLHGNGANGKSTFIEVVQHLLGDYAQQADYSTFSAGKGGPRNDVARLKGARFVSAPELERDMKLNEVLLKQMTGGDAITARFLFKEHFEFRPQCKIFLLANHLPIIRGDDYGIWRRTLLVPFNVTIPQKERDPALPEKLRSELPGILNWAIQGCLEWQQQGLCPPAEVKAAVAEYQEDMDPLSAFIAEQCCVFEGKTAFVKDLYGAYKSWAQETGEQFFAQRDFNKALAKKGFERKKSTNGLFRWLGIGLSQ